jgi:6-pyruvoyltetrahydropterin/6-carboxytetrahydropterin synthase
MGKFVSTKTYGHEKGYAVAYRQWRAESHCNLIHGYALSFYLEFESETVDVRNWVVDFGSLKTFKDFLDDTFDHTMLVAQDDPEFATFEMLHNKKLCKMVVVERTGCEGLSKFLHEYVNDIWLPDNGYKNVHCRVVKVAETPANSAWYEG